MYRVKKLMVKLEADTRQEEGWSVCGSRAYATTAKRRENIPKTRKQKDLQMSNSWAALFRVEEYKQFGATAAKVQGGEAGEASSEAHGLVYTYTPPKYFKEESDMVRFLSLRKLLTSVRVICHQRENIQYSKSVNHLLPNAYTRSLEGCYNRYY